MKKLSIFLILLLLSAIVSFGQTTMEEFNYITKGYKVQIESGLDMKKGYTLEDLGEWGLEYSNGGTRKTYFKGLYRENENTPCAIMMIYKYSESDNIYYICIPHPDSDEEIWDLTLKFISDNFSSSQNIMMAQAIIWALMHFASQEATN